MLITAGGDPCYLLSTAIGLRPGGSTVFSVISSSRFERNSSVYWVEEKRLATVTKQRRRPAAVGRGKNGSKPSDALEFAVGSLETELAAIGKAVPAREWAKVPVDYFANLDHYLHGASKKK